MFGRGARRTSWWVALAVLALCSLIISVEVGAGKALQGGGAAVYVPILLNPPRPTATPTATRTNTPTATPTFTATATATPSATATMAALQGWRGEYYDNPMLSGVPVLVRGDQDISFVWGAGSPAPGIPNDGFAVRWTREMTFAAASYTFKAQTDDGVRLWVDGNLLIDQWHDQGPTILEGTIYLNSGQHKIQMEYYDRTGYAAAKLWWEAGPSAVNWQGEYFTNKELLGDPTVVRFDPEINFQWGTGSPAEGIPADGFSARWTWSTFFVRGIYRFHTRSDDGIRLYVDNQLVIDKWQVQDWVEWIVDVPLETGIHFIRVEYFDEIGLARARFWWERADFFPQWKGEYWTNPTLSGAPAVTRNDPEVNFNWGTGSPAAGIPADNFSARWTRNMVFAAGHYRFYTNTSDGVRLWVDDVLLIDQWRDMETTAYSAPIALSDGIHAVQVEYYERGGTAVAMLWWQEETGYPDWRGEYYDNRNFAGAPVFVRNDETINFAWSNGAPGPGLNPDDFAVRWTREFNFVYSGEYTFIATTDDGVRVWIDDQLIMDQWVGRPETTNQVTRFVGRGPHRIRVEYFEGGGLASARFRWQGGPPFPEMIVDEGDLGFRRGGDAARWQESGSGYNGHLFWAPNTQNVANNWATWTPPLSKPGFYEVYAYVPAAPGNARGVRYYAFYDGHTWTSKRLDQSLYFDQWVSLGILPFKANGSELVYLTDLTGLPTGLEQVAFDALRFGYRGP